MTIMGNRLSEVYPTSILWQVGTTGSRKKTGGAEVSGSSGQWKQFIVEAKLFLTPPLQEE